MKLNIELVQKNDSDCLTIMEWRNDPITRQNSINQSPYTFETFKDIFYNKYFSNSIPPLFISHNSTKKDNKIAFIGSVNKNSNEIEISINLNPKWRGKKLSRPSLELGIEYIKNNTKINKIWALVKPSNIPSNKLFNGSGFIFIETKEHNGILLNFYLLDLDKQRN